MSSGTSFLKSKLVPAAIKTLSSALRVVPISGNLRLWSGVCGTADVSITIPSSHVSPGIPDADLVLYIVAAELDSSILAWALPCQTDQYGRPVAGLTVFNSAHISTKASDFSSQLYTAMHEITHVLGFSANSFPLYRDPNGNRYDAVVQSFSERDHRVWKMVTPKVLQVAREHFLCDTLNGLELEDGGGDGTSGSHWEARILANEYMTGWMGPDVVISPLTLAALEDSGWYRADFSQAQRLFWGWHAGCSFATGKCILPPVSAPVPNNPDYFCTSQTQGCTANRLAKATCRLTRWNSDLPKEYQYFTDTRLGGRDGAWPAMALDYCPVFSSAFSYCTMLNLQTADSDDTGETYCDTCRCFQTSLSAVSAPADTVGCYPFSCAYEDGQPLLTIAVRDYVSSSTISVQCPPEGGLVSVPGFGGSLTCPLADLLCPDGNVSLCPNFCSHRGGCVSGACVCASGYTLEDCSGTLCPAACSSHGSCNYTTGLCSCDPGWTLSSCSGRDCVDCVGDGAMCDYSTGSCLCRAGFFGPNCTLRYCSNNCSSHGVCDYTTGMCSCALGYGELICSSDDPFSQLCEPCPQSNCTDCSTDLSSSLISSVPHYRRVSPDAYVFIRAALPTFCLHLPLSLSASPTFGAATLLISTTATHPTLTHPLAPTFLAIPLNSSTTTTLSLLLPSITPPSLPPLLPLNDLQPYYMALYGIGDPNALEPRTKSVTNSSYVSINITLPCSDNATNALCPASCWNRGLCDPTTRTCRCGGHYGGIDCYQELQVPVRSSAAPLLASATPWVLPLLALLVIHWPNLHQPAGPIREAYG